MAPTPRTSVLGRAAYQSARFGAPPEWLDVGDSWWTFHEATEPRSRVADSVPRFGELSWAATVGHERYGTGGGAASPKRRSFRGWGWCHHRLGIAVVDHYRWPGIVVVGRHRRLGTDRMLRRCRPGRLGRLLVRLGPVPWSSKLCMNVCKKASANCRSAGEDCRVSASDSNWFRSSSRVGIWPPCADCPSTSWVRNCSSSKRRRAVVVG